MIFRQKSLRNRNKTDNNLHRRHYVTNMVPFFLNYTLGFIEKKRLFIESAIYLLRFIEPCTVKLLSIPLHRKNRKNDIRYGTTVFN